jgi:DNA-directed RNA polymerase specialized sigma24 family protein
MLQALQIADALAIAEASRRRSRDERAMVQYLGIGRKAPRAAEPPAASPLMITETIDLAAFESDERRRLEQAIEALSPEARRELIALVWLAQRPSIDFAAAIRRTRRIPPPAQTGYLMGIRIERYIARGLERIGYRSA